MSRGHLQRDGQFQFGRPVQALARLGDIQPQQMGFMRGMGLGFNTDVQRSDVVLPKRLVEALAELADVAGIGIGRAEIPGFRMARAFFVKKPGNLQIA